VATGDVTPSGTQTQAGTYKWKAGGVYSAPFTIPVNATVSYILGAMMVAAQSVLEFPMLVTPAYGTVTSTATAGNAGNGTVTALSVTTARPGDYKLTLVTPVANGGVFRLTDPDGNVVNSAITMTPGAGVVTPVTTGGLAFSLTDASADFALGDSYTITVPATKLNVTTKWKGSSANAARIFVEGPSSGVTFAYTQPAGGATNPSVSGALAQFGNVWYSLVLNGLNVADTTALDAIQTFGEGRWGELVRKPFVSFVGVNDADVLDATVVSSTRRTDRINSQIPSPGAFELPVIIAARGLARIAKVANQNPPRDYGSQPLTGLRPGADGSQWNYLQRDQAVKLGSSTVEVKDGVVNLSDVVTFYRPTGEEPPAYRYVVDIIKLQQVIFNLDLRFASTDWDGNPLIPNDQPTVNPDARKPKDAIAEANAILDSLGLAAIISDPKSAKKKTTCAITGPKRWDLQIVVQVSGNSNVKGIGLGFGFYYGAQAA
jgi:phage tail sheath gpL-like